MERKSIIKTGRVPEKKFAELVMNDIANNRPASDEVMLLMLKPKLGSFEDGVDTSPVFVILSQNMDESIPIIREWVDAIHGQHYMLPSLMVEYLLVVMTEQEFDHLAEKPDEITDKNFRIAMDKYIRATEEMSAT